MLSAGGRDRDGSGLRRAKAVSCGAGSADGAGSPLTRWTDQPPGRALAAHRFRLSRPARLSGCRHGRAVRRGATVSGPAVPRGAGTPHRPDAFRFVVTMRIRPIAMVPACTSGLTAGMRLMARPVLRGIRAPWVAVACAPASSDPFRLRGALLRPPRNGGRKKGLQGGDWPRPDGVLRPGDRALAGMSGPAPRTASGSGNAGPASRPGDDFGNNAARTGPSESLAAPAPGCRTAGRRSCRSSPENCPCHPAAAFESQGAPDPLCPAKSARTAKTLSPAERRWALLRCDPVGAGRELPLSCAARPSLGASARLLPSGRNAHRHRIRREGASRPLRA